MRISRVIIATAAILSAAPAFAGSLRYEPLSPGLGGNPNLNGYLVGTAQIQNQFVESGGDGGGGVPDISFPPIVIDLGGLGGGAEEPPGEEPAVNVPSATATQPLLRMP
jgi:hypothetical protein